MSEIEQKVRAAADALGIPYEAMACDPDLADTEAFCAHYGVAPEDSANCIVVASKREPRKFAACLVLATDRLDVNKTVRKKLGAKRCSFADAEETVALTGMRVGGVTPFGLPADLPIWIDARVMQRESVVVGGGSRSLKLRLAPDALAKLPGAEVVEGLSR